MSLLRDRLQTIEAIPDESLDYSDIPEADADFWRRAELQMPQPKKGIYIRLDTDVLTWYQTRMNAILRALMERDQQHPR